MSMDHRDFTASEAVAATAMTGVGGPPTASEIAAAADDVSPRQMLAAASPEGDVHIIVDAATARYMASAWATFHADPPMSTYRDWPADVIQLVTAAAHADLEAGRAYVIRRGFEVHPVDPADYDVTVGRLKAKQRLEAMLAESGGRS